MKGINLIQNHQKRKNNYMPHSTPSPTPLSMHKDSQTISKTKPKIRIIHIFAPEIIKTDVENFRELVQRLTGKPTHEHLHQKSGGCCRKIKKPRIPRKDEDQEQRNSIIVNNDSSTSSQALHEKPITNKKVEVMRTGSGFPGVKEEEGEEEEEEEGGEEMIWNNNINGSENTMTSGGYLNGFTDFDGFNFIQELGEFPLIPVHAFE